MNNTDILEEKEKKAIEYFENKIKNKLPLYKETYVDGKPYRINILQLETNFTEEQANKTEIILKLISNLIAENKELKEFKENIERIDKKQLDKLYKDAQKALKEYRETQNKVAKLEEENKELKEKIKEINEEYNAEQKHEMENTIPKSKVEEIIKKLDRDISNIWVSTNYDESLVSEKQQQIDILQSLLGKE